MSNKSIHFITEPIPFFPIVVNAFHWIQVASFESNPRLNTNEFFLIPLTEIENETKPVRFNAVRWLSNWMRVNAFYEIRVQKDQCDFMMLGDFKIGCHPDSIVKFICGAYRNHVVIFF